ncbi:MAG TPA: hypothetical protein VM344_03250 [Vitreimonas sp.]|nr:hypothetical protein [Vitreimonas sp.]
MTGTRSRPARRVEPPPLLPAPGLDLVSHRRLVEPTVDVTLPLRPGDPTFVTAGETVVAGTVVAERLRDAHLIEAAAGPPARAGERWSGDAIGGIRRGSTRREGELLFESNGRWRIATGEHRDPIETPVGGIVREVRPGMAVTVRAAGAALRGVIALGDPSRGRLEIATDRNGELLPRSLDVGSAGAILVVGARIDAEALTRARAMGIRGVVVATLPGKDRRDYLASEARQRAALHRLPPFGVLVLHGSQRRPIGEAAMALLERLAGRDVAIAGRPPALVFDPDGVPPRTEPPGAVHVRSGPLAGRQGTFVGLAGLRRFPGATHVEAAFVRFDDDPPLAVPLADLERLT